jgi:hypothetical protein
VARSEKSEKGGTYSEERRRTTRKNKFVQSVLFRRRRETPHSTRDTTPASVAFFFQVDFVRLGCRTPQSTSSSHTCPLFPVSPCVLTIPHSTLIASWPWLRNISYGEVNERSDDTPHRLIPIPICMAKHLSTSTGTTSPPYPIPFHCFCLPHLSLCNSQVLCLALTNRPSFVSPKCSR